MFAGPLSAHGNPVFIEQFTTDAMRVGGIAIPADTANALIIEGSAKSEGALTRSPDGRLVVLAGYQITLANAAALDSTLADAGAAAVPRALGVLDVSSAFALAGVTTEQFGGNNMRSGATDGRGNYWGAGAASGTFYFGSGPANIVQALVANTTVIQDLGGDLYFSASKGAPGIWKIAGTPTVPAPVMMFLNSGSESSPVGFAFNGDFTIAYVADDSMAGNAGIQRWDLTAGAWSRTYAFTALTNVGARGIAVDFSKPHPVIYATTAETVANRLVSITDNGASSSLTTLATAGANQLFRGIAFAPSAGLAPEFIGAIQTPDGLKLTWTTLLNRSYTLEYTANLLNPGWHTVTNLTATSPVLTATDPTAPAGANRFYRLVVGP